MYVNFPVIFMSKISPASHISGTVTDTAGNPLSRLVLLFNSANDIVDRQWSDSAGNVRFDLPAGRNVNDKYVARAIGNINECDDVSCPMQGAV